MFDFKTHRQIDEIALSEIIEIQSKVFESPFSSSKISSRFDGKDYTLSVHVYKNNQIIGFKTGYSQEPGIFYSWIGGVLPEHQKQGIASTLMQTQHQVLKKDGFHTVRTKSENMFKNMIILNLKSGFDIINTTTSNLRGLQIVFEKKLIDS